MTNLVMSAPAQLARGELTFGGWIGTMLQQMQAVSDVSLGVVVRGRVPSLVIERHGRTLYYLLPQRGRFDVAQADCRRTIEHFGPDVLHVEGTESAHAGRFLRSWPGKNVVSLQGIINGYEPHQFGSLRVGEMLMSGRPVEVLAASTLVLNKIVNFNPRLRVEAESLRLAQNFLGRTSWDRAYSHAANPTAPYFHCNRILRPAFYEHRWEIGRIRRHSILIGNSATPLKGAHIMLEALAILKHEFPDIRLYVAGESPVVTSFRQWKKVVGYAAYLRYRIRALGLESHVEFTGVLSAAALASRLCSVNAYVLCSIIENGPNTLGEAMVLGVPSVAAFVGGAPDMARHDEEVLFYRDSEPKLLAWQLRKIFNDHDLARRLSENARRRAVQTHDPQTAVRDLLRAYDTILGSRNSPDFPQR